MNIKHENSPCCQAKIYKFGDKRRQCSKCKKTWTKYAKKRGRKAKRPNQQLVNKVLGQGKKLVHLAERKGSVCDAALSQRLKKSMSRKKRENEYPQGWLILIADALWFEFKGQRWTLYVMAVRSTTGGKAYFFDPVLLQGRESGDGWRQALGSIPLDIENRLLALVSDGFRGLCLLAKENKWVNQRCHFHLILQFQIQLGDWKNLPDSPYRKEIFALVCGLLRTRNKEIECTEKLYELLSDKKCPRRYRMIGMEFLRRLNDFRAYLKYPELHLPHTTNCIESFNKIIRDRCKHVRTPQALKLRAVTLMRVRTTVNCNHRDFQQN
ncbi:MAG: transposase [Patescibacteria group bacterium]